MKINQKKNKKKKKKTLDTGDDIYLQKSKWRYISSQGKKTKYQMGNPKVQSGKFISHVKYLGFNT